MVGEAFLLKVLLLPISEPCAHEETSHGRLLHKRELQGCPYLEGALVDVHVKATLDPLRLAEQDEVLKEEDMSLALPAAQPDGEFILPHQLPLLLQVHLNTGNILVRPHRMRSGQPQTAGFHVAVVKKWQLCVILGGFLEEVGLCGIAGGHIRLNQVAQSSGESCALLLGLILSP